MINATQVNGQSLDGATHQELHSFIIQSGARELSLIVTSKTRVYGEYAKILRSIRADNLLSADVCEALKAKHRRVLAAAGPTSPSV